MPGIRPITLKCFISCATLVSLVVATRGSDTLAAKIDDPTTRIPDQFHADRDTVQFSYSATYNFLFLKLKKIGRAVIDVTEGQWTNRYTGSNTPACVVKLHFDSRDAPGARQRGRLSFHNSSVSVLTMPGLETILHVVRNDEDLNPFFKERRRVKSIDIYDVESGTLNYRRHDLLTGVTSTNLAASAEAMKQSEQVSSFLKVIAELMRGKKKRLRPGQDKLILNVDDQLVEFSITIRREKHPGRILGNRNESLRLHMEPDRDLGGKARKFTLWAMPFVRFAESTGNQPLIEMARSGPDYASVPLVLDSYLSLGKVRCRLNRARVKTYSPIVAR